MLRHGMVLDKRSVFCWVESLVAQGVGERTPKTALSITEPNRARAFNRDFVVWLESCVTGHADSKEEAAKITIATSNCLQRCSWANKHGRCIDRCAGY
jgi:hypothetical protein